MAAAARAAREAGGLTVGILPGTEAQSADPAIVLPLPTGLGEARNVLVVQVSEAIIAIGGGAGTLSEIGFALKLLKPLVLLGSWSVHPPEGADPPAISTRTARTPEEAVDFALHLIRR